MNEHLVSLRFQEDREPFLLDLSSLLYDFELAHDLSVLLAEQDYSRYRFNRFFWFRNGRPLKTVHRARTARVIKESPLLLDVVIPSLGAIWILIQVMDKVANWNVNREKLELKVRRLRREEESHKQIMTDAYVDQLDDTLDRRDARQVFEKVVSRLEKSPIHLSEVEISRKTDGKNS
jgi:hypothetical protein